MYELLGISLTLAALVTINSVASSLVAASWRLLQAPLRNTSAQTRAEFLFALRMAPSALAIVAVTVFLIPSYIGYEPQSASENVSKKLALIALISAAGLAFALWRALRGWLATRMLLREWLTAAQPFKVPGVTVATYRISHSFPIIAVVGTLRPRLFIAERVLDTLSQEELLAAVAHERGHLAARDNLKRALLRGCRDVLMIIPCGRELDRAWGEAAEAAADEHAARQTPQAALELAAALVKIAKMVPAGARATMPTAAFLVGWETTRGVKMRISRLLEIASLDRGSDRQTIRIANLLPVLFFASLLMSAITVAGSPRVLITVHSIIEATVKLLC